MIMIITSLVTGGVLEHGRRLLARLCAGMVRWGAGIRCRSSRKPLEGAAPPVVTYFSNAPLADIVEAFNQRNGVVMRVIGGARQRTFAARLDLRDVKGFLQRLKHEGYRIDRNGTVAEIRLRGRSRKKARG
jgi:hypothetical protein